MHRKAARYLPPLNGAFVAAEESADLFPSIEAPIGAQSAVRGAHVPIFPDLSSIAVCTAIRITGLYLVHRIAFTIFIFPGLPCVGGTNGAAPCGNEFPGSFPSGVASAALADLAGRIEVGEFDV